jgi:DnaK suppressor protein
MTSRKSNKATAVQEKKRLVDLPTNYKPTDKEEYMNEKQLAYFRQRLLNWKEELKQESKITVEHLQKEQLREADLSDQATNESVTAFELRTRDRYRKLMNKIDSALSRIEEGEYGFCDETGDPIGIKRLEARPIATLSIEAQERHERFEKSHSED